MSESRIIESLTEGHANAPGEKRELIEVGRRLVRCQRCGHWDHRGCDQFTRQEWVEILIRPGRECPNQLASSCKNDKNG